MYEMNEAYKFYPLNGSFYLVINVCEKLILIVRQLEQLRLFPLLGNLRK